MFAFLRQKDGYDNDVLRESLDPEKNRKMVFKAGESQGKSGSFFFFCKDQRFIIKTMTDDDFNAFQRIQKAYFARVCKSDESLLARVYGIYSVKMEDQKPVKLIVMENSMRGARDHLGVFDLKGSMVNRIVEGKNFKPTSTLKDRNLLAMNKEKIWLRFSNKDRKQILTTMKRDCALLKTYNMMDYSLLLCIQENHIYKTKKAELMQNSRSNSVLSSTSGDTVFKRTLLNEVRKEFVGSRHLFMSSCGKYLYHIGIIDYLQDFNADKKLENFLKYHVKQDGDGISAMPPPFYAERFMRFMRDHVIVDQKNSGDQKKSDLRLTGKLPKNTAA